MFQFEVDKIFLGFIVSFFSRFGTSLNVWFLGGFLL